MNNILTLFGSDSSSKNYSPSTEKGTTQVHGVGSSDTDLVSSITGILNGVIAVLGLVCVVVIIIGGVNYMTSSGDSGKVKKAKDTILYGIIGLIICVLAFAIVNFVLANILS